MSGIAIALLVFFVIVAILLVLLVLVQNDEGDSLGGMFGGGSSTAFGSRSGNVLTRATTVLGALFLVISLSMALVNRSSTGRGVESAGRQLAPEAESTIWWENDNTSVLPAPEPDFIDFSLEPIDLEDTPEADE